MINLYKVLKNFIPIGTHLYIKELDSFVVLTKLNDEDSTTAIECKKSGITYYFNKTNLCTNHIDNNYKLLPSKEWDDWKYIINIRFGEPVMFRSEYNKEWTLGRYYGDNEIIINNIHYSKVKEIIPVKYFDFDNL